MRPHRSLFLLTALFSYIQILAAFVCLFLFVSFHLIFSYSFITSASLLIPTSTSSLQKSVVSYFPTLYALVILGAPSSRFSCHSPPTSSSFTPSLLICLHPSLLPLSPRTPSSFLPPVLKANTAFPCPRSKTLLCPLTTVLESHCRLATQYAQWPRGPTMAHFNLNFPRNEWEPTPVHAACLLIGPS